jgi:hypothetical protein
MATGNTPVNGPDPNEDWIYKWAARLFVALVLASLFYLLSGHGIVMPSAPRVSPNGVTTTMGDASRTP